MTSTRLFKTFPFLLAGAFLAAQAPSGFDIGFGAAKPLDALQTITQSSRLSPELSVGYNGHLAATPVPFRASFGYALFPGETQAGRRQSFRLLQLGGDLFIETGAPRLRLTTGLTLNRWTSKVEEGGVSTTEHVRGLKIGARAGLDVTLTPQWSVGAMLQVVELGTNADRSAPLNPSWVSLGARYRF